ncbi:hypothetical protein P7C71_g3684, partial [Lecanoromycetidae sp. Uapishka_2]
MLRDDDTLIEEQLRLDYNPVNTNALRSPAVETMAGTNAEEEGLAQEMASLVNGEVFRGKAKPAVEKLGKGKRKRRDDDAVEESSSKRGKKTTEVLDPGAAPSTDAAAPNRAQRGRPQKSKKQASPVERTPNAGPSEEQHRRRSSRVANQGSPVSVKTPPGKLKPRAKRQELQRHMINTYPAVGPAKKDRDVYDDFPGSPESEPARPNQSKQRAGEASRQMRASEREDARARRVEVVESVAVQDSGEREDLVEPGDEGLDQEESSRAQHEDTDSDNDSGDKDEDKDDDEDDEENQQNVDLLGEEKDWAKILNAARSICGPRLLANRTPSLLTTTIKELIQDIKEARNLYKQLLPSAGMDRNQMEGLRAQIYDILTAIEEQIGDEMISETKALTESSEMIQDIYRRAIPAIKDDIERNRLKWRSSKKERNGANIDVDVDIDDQHSQAPRIKQAHRSTEWSDKEIRVLFRQLEDEYIPDQPDEDVKGHDPAPDNESAAKTPRSASHSQRSSPKKDAAETHSPHVNGHIEENELPSHEDHEDHEELNREIALRNETIRGLRREVGKLQATNEHKVDELVDVQTKSLRLELDSVRSTLVDVDDAYRTALEKHNEALRARDEDVQRVSKTAQELQEKLQAFEEGNEQDLIKHDELVRSKDDEIQKLTSHCSILKKRDGLVRTKDEEIQRVSKIVEDLREELRQSQAKQNSQENVDVVNEGKVLDVGKSGESMQAKNAETDKLLQTIRSLEERLQASDEILRKAVKSEVDQNHQLLQTKDTEMKNSSQIIRNLEERLQAAESAKEQEVDKSVHSLRDEFRDLQAKHKRKIEEVEAVASARIEATCQENEAALVSKDDDIARLRESEAAIMARLEANQSANEELLRLKDNEIARTQENEAAMLARLEAAQEEKEVLLCSSNEEIEKLRRDEAARIKRLETVLNTKDQEIKELKENEAVASAHVEALQREKDERLKSNDEVNEQMEGAEAAASARVEAVQRENQDLLQSREQEIKELADLVQDLENKVETARKVQQEEIKAAIVKHELYSAEAAMKYQESVKANVAERQELQAVLSEREQDVEALKAEHEQDLNDAGKRHREELESARAEQEELQKAITRHQKKLREDAMTHEREIEAMISKHREDIAIAAKSDDQSLSNAVAEHGQEIADVKAKHQQELEVIDNKSRDIATRSEQHLESVRQEHALVLREEVAKRDEAMASVKQDHAKEIRDADTKYAQDLESVERQRDGFRDAAVQHEQDLQSLKGGNEKLQAAVAKHEQEMETVKQQHASDLQDLIANHERTISEANTSEEELRGITMKKEQDMKDLITRHQEDTKETAQKHQEDLDIAAKVLTEHRNDMQAAVDKHLHELGISNGQADQLRIEIEKYRREIIETTQNYERQTGQITKEHDKELGRASAECETFKSGNELLQQKLRDLTSKHERKLGEVSEANADFRNQAGKARQHLEDAILQHEQQIEELTSRHQQALGEVAREHERQIQDLTLHPQQVPEDVIVELERQIHELTAKHETAVKEAASSNTALEAFRLKADEEVHSLIAEAASLRSRLELAHSQGQEDKRTMASLETDVERVRKEAGVEEHLLRDKLKLAEIQSQKDHEAITALRKDMEGWQFQYAEVSRERDDERKETTVEIALLKDKLELAELQSQRAREDMEIERNETAVELALLNDKLELAELQSRKDRDTISTLQQESQRLQIKALDSSDSTRFTHHQLREELSMLERHHAANLDDVAALKANMIAERDAREREWRQRAQAREQIGHDMKTLAAELAVQ